MLAPSRLALAFHCNRRGHDAGNEWPSQIRVSNGSVYLPGTVIYWARLVLVSMVHSAVVNCANTGRPHNPCSEHCRPVNTGRSNDCMRVHSFIQSIRSNAIDLSIAPNNVGHVNRCRQVWNKKTNKFTTICIGNDGFHCHRVPFRIHCQLWLVAVREWPLASCYWTNLAH